MKNLLALLLLLPAISNAQNYCYSWTAPSVRVDGTPLTTSDLSHYTLYDCEGEVLVDNIPATESIVCTPEPTNKTQCAQVSAVDLSGVESDKSVSVSINSNAPEPPSLLEVVFKKIIAWIKRVFDLTA